MARRLYLKITFQVEWIFIIQCYNEIKSYFSEGIVGEFWLLRAQVMETRNETALFHVDVSPQHRAPTAT